MNILTISILEGLYIIYMLNFFKTKYSLAHPMTYFNNKYLWHPIGTQSKPISNVCKFGNNASWFLAAYFIVRGYLFQNKVVKKKKLIFFNKLVLACVFLFSLMNFNVVIYLLPIFIIEYCLFMN